jgi:hypothetical protein
MSIGRITMMEWTSEEAMLAAEKHYLSIQKEAFSKRRAFDQHANRALFANVACNLSQL